MFGVVCGSLGASVQLAGAGLLQPASCWPALTVHPSHPGPHIRPSSRLRSALRIPSTIDDRHGLPGEGRGLRLAVRLGHRQPAAPLQHMLSDHRHAGQTAAVGNAGASGKCSCWRRRRSPAHSAGSPSCRRARAAPRSLTHTPCPTHPPLHRWTFAAREAMWI